MSENAPSAQDGTLLVVVYDTYQDPRFAPLRGAVRQVDDLADELSPFGYRLTALTNTDQDLLTTGLAQWSAGWRADGGHGPAVVAWSGHGEITPKGICSSSGTLFSRLALAATGQLSAPAPRPV